MAGLGASRTVMASAGVAVGAVAYALLAVMSLPPSLPLVTTYGAASPTARVAGLLAGLLLLAAGALAVTVGSSRRVGAVLTAAGVAWFAPDWAGWEGGPALVRGLATVTGPLLPVLLLGLLATSTIGRRLLRVTVAAGGVVGLIAVGWVMVDDPFLRPQCWPTCSDSALLVTSLPELATGLGLTLAGARATVGATAAIVAVRLLLTASVAARRWEGALLVGTAFAGAAEASYGVALLTRVEDGEDPIFAGIYLARAAAWSILGLLSLYTTQRFVGRRRGLSVLAAELETAPSTGALAARLRSVTGDHQLDVHYPAGRDGDFVTADGQPVVHAADTGQTATSLRSGEQTVAVVVHDRAVLPVDVLEQVLGPAARLGLENERLAAERLARLRDVQDSRRRIVKTGDETRRRLERDLHDGAQQSLLALSFRLRVARDTAEQSGDEAARSDLDRALAAAQVAMDDLRSLAGGIHPAVLSQAGLAVALQSLAEESSVPVELDDVTSERFAASVELAAYAVVQDAAQRAPATGSPALLVRAVRQQSALVVTVDGHPGDVPPDIGDRVGALGGHLVPTEQGVRAELPCGS